MKAIYCITNKITGKRYVGSAIDFYGRKRTHLSKLRRNIHHSKYLQRAWNKYGGESFEFLVLEKIDKKEDLIIKEQWWIDNTPCEYNVCKIAGSSLGTKRSKETIQKLREKNLGLKHPEWRNKIKSESQGGINHWSYGKKMPDEVKQKKSIAMKKRYNEGYIHPYKKTVLKYSLDGNFIQEFTSLNEAGNYNIKKIKAIGNCLRRKSKSSQGFLWKYKNKTN